MKKALVKLIPVALLPFAVAVYRKLNLNRWLRQRMRERNEIRSGQRSALTPPQRKLYSTTNVEEFERVGRDFFNYFTSLIKIKPDDHILDVGCGQGRMAAPLTKFLSKKGRLEGFDIRPSDIEWCQQTITPKYPNFKFQVADVYNKAYHPEGKQQASEYKFPYKDNSFDFVYLTSVFTHMLPKDMENYFSEIARVLKPGGQSLITYFLINDESRALNKTDQTTLQLNYDFPGYISIHKDIPEWAVGFEQDYIFGLYRKNGMQIDQVHHGSWCGRSQYLSYQDMVIARKV